MAEGRAGVTAMSGDRGRVFLFGGIAPNGTPSSTLLRFETSVAPAGAYQPLDAAAELARSAAQAAPLGGDTFLVTGKPPVLIDGPGAVARPLADGPALPGAIASAGDETGAMLALICGDGVATSGALVYQFGGFAELSAPSSARRAGHAVTAVGAGIAPALIAIGGSVAGVAQTSALRYRLGASAIEEIPGALARGRNQAAIAATDRFLLIAGGSSAEGMRDDAELLDALTLERVGALPMLVPRSGAVALPFANGQILIAGGVDAKGRAIEIIELFTPDA
jgi:hypothetical protein